MVTNLIGELGYWNWIILGVALLALEVLAPGVYLLWIGIAALLTGALSWQLDGFAFWTWQLQVLVFLALSIAAAFTGRRVTRSGSEETDEPLLNQRAEQLVGRSAVLVEPIAQGIGRVRLGDSTWRVRGPDLPAGTPVRITEVRNSELIVTPDTRLPDA